MKSNDLYIMNIYITKYALTKGIIVKEAEVNGNIAEVRGTSYGGNIYRWREGPNSDFQYTKEKAKDQAERMRKKKIASLEKQIANLSDMRFHY